MDEPITKTDCRQTSSASSVPTSGKLVEYSPFQLYYLIAAENITCKLTLSSAQRSYEIYFRKGCPEAATPASEDEDLGSYLAKKGSISQAQLAEARKIALGKDLVSGLSAFLSSVALFSELTEHSIAILRRALMLSHGTFSLESGGTRPANSINLGDKWALACEAARTIPIDEIENRLGKFLDCSLMKTGGKVDISDIKLTPQEIRMASNFDGVRSLSSLCDAFASEKPIIIRTAFILQSFGLCSFGSSCKNENRVAGNQVGVSRASDSKLPDSDSGGPPRIGPRQDQVDSRFAKYAARVPNLGSSTPIDPKSKENRLRNTISSAARCEDFISTAGSAKIVSAPRPGIEQHKVQAAVVSNSQIETEVTALKKHLASLKDKNHFEALGIPENANASQIKAAYFNLAKSYHPDTSSGGPAEIVAAKAEIFSRISEAYGVLGDEKRRAKYIEEQKSGGQVDVGSIFAAEEAFQKGCILIKARNYTDAAIMLEKAVELYDGEGEYFAWRGWVRFLCATDKRAAKEDARKDLDKAIKMNPKCAQAYYFMGQIHKLLGDTQLAQKWFKQTLGVDPKHIEAQRELRR